MPEFIKKRTSIIANGLRICHFNPSGARVAGRDRSIPFQAGGGSDRSRDQALGGMASVKTPRIRNATAKSKKRNRLGSVNLRSSVAGSGGTGAL